jgi:hypothetical protein
VLATVNVATVVSRFIQDDMEFFFYSGLFAPYCFIVIPLTLVSASMLLSDPRKACTFANERRSPTSQTSEKIDLFC